MPLSDVRLLSRISQPAPGKIADTHYFPDYFGKSGSGCPELFEINAFSGRQQLVAGSEDRE